ncbi:HigA family addiction module antitoxin [Alcaligenaceae bacterium A4P071]|nr:HigA family addiction module antitoxin [Alcaligenaceae bacterium A4P071]
MARMHHPPHPGTVLAEWIDGLDDMNISRFAQHIHVTRATLSRILHGHAAITPELALRLESALGASSEMWLGLQAAYDLWTASQRPRPAIVLLTGNGSTCHDVAA